MDANNNNSTADTNSNTNGQDGAARVQHVAKKSSDELLRKFAQVGSASDDKKELRLAKRIKRSSNVKAIKAGVYSQGRMYVDQGSSLNGASVAIVERKCLLPPPPAVPSSRKSPALLVVRRLGIGRVSVRARDIKHKSILGAIEKTWRKTVEGASRVFMEKHYNQHKRLTNDMY